MTTQSLPEVAVVSPQNVRPTRIRKSTKKDDFVYSCYSSSFASFVASVHSLHKPESYTKAICDPIWQSALAKELTTLHQTHTWDLVPLPAGKRAIGTCWVYKIKTKSDGSIERYKSRLVTKGYPQKFVPSHHDSALFVKRSSVGRILLSLYVDDMIITGDDCDGIELLKAELSHRFAMKDLGLLRYFLGIEVASSPKGYLLSQSKYIADLFDHARMTNNKIADIPIDAKANDTPTDSDLLPDPSLYRTIVGSLVYLITLLFPSTSSLNLRAYCDADWAGDTVTRKSIIGFCVFLGESLISWKNLGVHITCPAPLYCDNHSAIQIAFNTVFYEQTKHIKIDCHFTRHHLWVGTISLPFVPSSLLITDILTKPHCGSHFHFLSDKLSMFLAAT
ncbi:uncharacterized mitochondrial protein-like protein [Tanacetum coccineum]